VPSGAERKLVTVLFADLVGSTALADRSDPERVRAQLERFYAAMRDEIALTGGTVEKFVGDAVLAVFGAPSALEDHAERALHTALAMQERMRTLFGDALELRVGVNTGEVVVGGAHAGGSFVTGDAVNVADRLQKAAEPGEVLAGDRTVAAAAGAFVFGEHRRLEVKGKGAGVVASPVVRALRTMRPRGVRGVERIFLGRESELELLRATYRRTAARSEPHLVTIVGEPGVGKSRLVRELWDVLGAESPAPIARTGRCLAYGAGITYWPLGEVVREHYGLREGDAPEAVVERLGRHEILGLALGLDIAPDLHPLDAREGLHAAAVELIEEVAAECPTVLFVEDIHWAEPDLLDLLERLAADVRAPVMLLATARPEILDLRPTWGAGRRNTTLLWLDPLPATTASELLSEMASGALPDDLRELVVSRAGGNPFFLEELVGALVDSGVLVRSEDTWTLGERDPSFVVPDTVHAVLAARIDRLPPRDKAVLQAASVVGRRFWTEPVAHLLGGEEPDLAILEDRDLITSRRRSSLAGGYEYAIKHALTREVAYGSIPKARRGRLHAMLADWLGESSVASDERAPLVAYHYAEAANPEDADLVWAGDPDGLARVRAKAVHWLARAGTLARGRYEMEEAIELFTRAALLCDDEHDRALLWRSVGEAHALRYDGEGMRTALLRALEGPLDDAERADTFALLALQASLRSSMWSIRLNRELIEEWSARALDLAAPGSEARVRAILARSNVDPETTSEVELTEALELAEALGSVSLRSYALSARSVAAFERRRFREASDWNERRLALLPEIDDPDHLCDAYENAAPIAAAVGRFDEAARFAQMHNEIARRLSPHHRVHAVSLELELADVLGDWPGIVSSTHRVVDTVAANLSTPCVRNPRGLLLCAAAHACEGDEARAAELEREAERIGGVGYDSYLSGPRLRLAVQRADRASAERLIELPVERGFVWGAGAMAARLDALLAFGRLDLVELEAPRFVQDALVLEPFALRALGAARSDDELLERADALFAQLGLDWHRAQTERLLDGV
jgi:class 3 adenylate cyclase